MCWANEIATFAFETGPVQDAGAKLTCSGLASENEPLVRWPGSETLSVASPAVEVTVALVEAVYSLSAPGVNGPKLAGAPSVSDSVAGTVPPTPPMAHELTGHVATVCRPGAASM